MIPVYAHALVIGGTSGIGKELAKQLLATGAKTAVIGRNLTSLDELRKLGAIGYEIDVDVIDDAEDKLARIALDLGGLDLVIYAAGIMPAVGPEEFNSAKDKAMFTTNLVSAATWLNAVAVRFAATGRGNIVAIGSVAGDRGRAGQPAYNASKAGLHSFVESLRNRLSNRGVCVVTIKPGPVATPMTEWLNLPNPMAASEAAARILRLSNKSGEHYLLISHRFIFFVIRLIPSRIFRRFKV